MSIAYQQLAALCRLANYGIDSISDTAPAESEEMTIKELKAWAKSELVRIARVISTTPKDKLGNVTYCSYYLDRQIFSRNEFNCYDEDEGARAETILEIVGAIGKCIQINETPFVSLWLALDMHEYKFCTTGL